MGTMCPQRPVISAAISRGLGLEQRTGARKLQHSDCNTGRQRSGFHVFIPHLAVMREIGADIDHIVVEFNDVLKTGADRGERCLYVRERNFHLFPAARMMAMPPCLEIQATGDSALTGVTKYRLPKDTAMAPDLD